MDIKDLIAKDINGNTAVSMRDLHDWLGSKAQFTNWASRMFEYGFTENVDYVVFNKNVKNLSGGRPSKDYAMTLDMAKEVSMLQRNEKGKEARQYFIKVEKEYKKATPKKLSAIEKLELTTKGVLELDDRVSKLETNMPVNRHDIRKVWNVGRSQAIKALGGKDSKAYKEIGTKVFQRVWNDFNNHFGLMSYRDLPVSKAEEAKEWLKNSWHLSMELQDEVETINGNLPLF